MKFIGRAKNCADHPDSDEQRGPFRMQVECAAQRPPEKSRQNCILDKVPKLAQRKMDRGDRRDGDLRIEPTQKGHEITGCLLRRKGFSGTGENYAEPKDNRQPVFEKSAQLHLRNCSGDRIGREFLN